MTGSRTLSPVARRVVRVAAGVGILVAIVAVVGAEPFLRGLSAVSPAAVAAAFALTAIATAAAAWRWRAVARRLGMPLGWPSALAAYYRSQLLNSVLPGGVAGDVHRAVAHGRDAGRLAPAARAVAAERVGGQLVQLAAAAVVLAALGIRLDGWAVPAVVALAAVSVSVVVVLAVPRLRRVAHREAAAARLAFGSPGAVATVVVTSLVVVGAHTATFAVACAAVGVHADPARIIVVSLLAVLAASVPLGVGGWGPRESVAAWAFAAAGLGAADGVAASTAFGVLATIAVLPGAVVLLLPRIARSRAVSSPRVLPVPLAAESAAVASRPILSVPREESP